MSGAELHLKASGLFTDPSPMLAPDGALRIASNVDIDREGVVTPRPGFATILASAPSSNVVKSMFPYQGHILCAASPDGSYSSFDWHWDGAGSAVTSIGDPVSGRRHKTATARKSLYITATSGVRKLTSSADLVAESAGRAWSTGSATLLSAGTPRAILTATSVAYRWCFTRTDANSYIVRSAPSPYLRLDNASGGTRDGNLLIVLPADAIAGDVIEIYRSVGATTPADTEYLARTYTITSTDVSNLYATVVDTTVDDELGAELYTNQTQEGIDQANELPPLARDIAVFAGCMFYAATTGRQRMLLNALSWDRGFASTGKFGLLAPLSVASATYTSGSPTVTAASVSSSVRGGMALVVVGAEPTDAGPFPAGSYVVSATGTTITMSANATATDTKNLKLCDTVTINAVRFVAWTSTIIAKQAFYASNTAGSGLRDTTSEFAYCVNRQVNSGLPRVSPVFTDTTQTIIQLLFEEIGVNGSAFTVASSAQWDPDVMIAPRTSTNDVFPHGIFWSKPQQPEAVPLVNYALIGSETQEIQRIVATRDALFIFKRDGTWRLTGDTPETFRIDPFDRTLRLISEEGICEHRGTLFAWTERGFGAINDSGFVPVSDQRIAYEIKAAQDLCSTYPAITSQPVAFACSHPVDDRVIFGVSTTAKERADAVYVFHPGTMSWTSYDITARCAAYDVDTNSLYFGSPSTTYDVHKQRPITDAVRYADAKQSGNMTKSGNNVTLTSISTTPVVGDLLYQSGARAIVTVIVTTSPLVVTVDDSSALSGSGAAVDVYSSFASAVEWVAKTAENPGMRKLWREGSVGFDTLANVAQMALSFRSDVSLTAVSKTVSRTRANEDKPKSVRTLIPRAHARCTYLFPKLTIRQAGAAWRLSSLSLVAEPMSERVGRAA